MKKLQPLFVLAASALALTGCIGGGDKSKSGDSSGSSVKPIDPAQGVQSFVYSSVDERTEILGTLEKYAVDNKLTGLTLFNNGGYVMYHPSVVKAATSYVPGYGFGILGDGDINADLEGESNPLWKRYLHTYESEDPGQVNSMNSKESTVSDVQSYMTASYFDTQMNETRDGYDWVASLAKDQRPIAVDADKTTGLATTFKFRVRVGSELKYNTNSSVFAKYNGREVALEDYITPYKILYTQAYGMARSGESLTGAGSIKGRKAYYEGTKTGEDAELWAGVGIKSFTEGGDSWLQFTFNTPCTPFYAMYYLASGMMAPVPADFIKELGDGSLADGIKIWGANNTLGTLTPVDTWLSTGPYTLERWDIDQQIVLKKNPLFEDHGRYKIGGVHLNILKAIQTDNEAALKEFLASKLHSCGIPSTRLAEFRDDPRATTTVGDSNFKLNLNTCDQATWESLFGVNGTIEQTPKSEYWECEPAMSNKDFVSGLSFAIDRKSFAKNLGRAEAFEYFAPTYLSDPENGVSYNTTEAHKQAIASLVEGTDGVGYSKELATKAFIAASEKLIADGVYKEGDTIELEIAWQVASDEKTYHAAVEKDIEAAFNVDENPLSLDVKFWVGSSWSDVYYKKAMIGQFDIAMGSISGNSYDPLGFMNVLSTDPNLNQNFCLNWGIDTNNNDGSIIYDGHTWSFDGLFQAANAGAYIVDGKNSPLFEVTESSAKREADGSIVVSGKFDGALVMDGEDLLAYGTMAAMCIFGTSNDSYGDYAEFYVYNTDLFEDASDDPTDTASYLTVDEENGTFEAHFSKAVADAFTTLGTYAAGFDVYSFTYLLGEQSTGFYKTIVDKLPK